MVTTKRSATGYVESKPKLSAGRSITQAAVKCKRFEAKVLHSRGQSYCTHRHFMSHSLKTCLTTQSCRSSLGSMLSSSPPTPVYISKTIAVPDPGSTESRGGLQSPSTLSLPVPQKNSANTGPYMPRGESYCPACVVHLQCAAMQQIFQ